ncbi:hypothetical protein GCM10009634_70180 [Saccharothrix xinjiangensis]
MNSVTRAGHAGLATAHRGTCPPTGTGADIGLPGHLRRATGLPFERVDRAEHGHAAATLTAPANLTAPRAPAAL